MEIIDRLRSGMPCKESDGRTCRAIDGNAGCDCAMAADEIERLRAENTDLRMMLSELGWDTPARLRTFLNQQYGSKE